MTQINTSKPSEETETWEETLARVLKRERASHLKTLESLVATLDAHLTTQKRMTELLNDHIDLCEDFDSLTERYFAKFPT